MTRSRDADAATNRPTRGPSRERRGPTLRIVDEDDDDPGRRGPGAGAAGRPRGVVRAGRARSTNRSRGRRHGPVRATARRRPVRVRRARAAAVGGPTIARATASATSSGVRHRRPLTRVGVIAGGRVGIRAEVRAGARPAARREAARRRIDYHHALRDLRLLGDVTPLALDGRIEVADVGDERELVVHTETFAPLETGIDADAEYVERVAAERLARYAVVGFAGLSVEVVVARERLLGSDAFERRSTPSASPTSSRRRGADRGVQTAHLGDHRQRRRRRPRGVRRRARSAVPRAAAHRAQHPGVARRGRPPSPLRAGRPRARGPAGRLAVRPRSPRRSGVLRAPRLRRRRNLNGPDPRPRPELGGRGRPTASASA